MSTEWKDFIPTFTGVNYGVFRRMKHEFRRDGNKVEMRLATAEWVYEIPKIKLPRKLKKKLYGVNGRRKARKLNRAAKNRPPKNILQITLSSSDGQKPIIFPDGTNAITYEIE